MHHYLKVSGLRVALLIWRAVTQVKEWFGS